MTKRVYLVDTENVNSTWKELLPLLTGNDRLILFYTANSPYLSYPDFRFILAYKEQFEMVECYTGNNGLDFQLVSYLGYLLKTAAKTEYVIVSNDTGYDPVIRFWSDRERLVSRMTSRQLVKLKYQHPTPAPEKALPDEADPEEAAEPAAEEAAEPAPQPEKKPARKSSRRRSSKAKTAAPAEEAAVPAEPAAPAEEPAAPAEEVPAAPEQPAETAAPAPAEEAPAEAPEASAAAPAEEKPAEAAPAEKPAAKPRKRQRKPKQEKAAAPAEQPVPEVTESPAEEAAPAEEAEPLPEEDAPVKPGTPADQIIRDAVGSGCEDATLSWILEMLGKYDPRHFSLIHSDLQKHFGQEQGVVYYKQLRPVLRKYYSAVKTEQ